MLDGQKIDETFLVTFGNKLEQLSFALELTRAESQLDPGTNRAATYTSFVKLYDERRDIFGDNHMITMNEPLDYLGYKVYQSRFENFGIDDESGKQLAGSVFTIGRDPGLWLKYLGTGMLGLGIATMFWMKAYFFKPKGRHAAT
ncbi:MAG: cytochrome c biogenesis protein ResB [Gemmatales bacterium]